MTTLRKYVGDLLALERHILDAVKQQLGDDRTRLHPEAFALISKLDGVLSAHLRSTEQHLATLGGDAFAPIKEAVGSALGFAAGLIDRVRENPVSKMLRDDYTALGLTAISYTMLHTTGLALKSQPTADLAMRHLKDITPLIVETSELIPTVVAKELVDDGELVDTAAGEEAARNTQQAWRNEVVRH
jgi:hypothetical protein